MGAHDVQLVGEGRRSTVIMRLDDHWSMRDGRLEIHILAVRSTAQIDIDRCAHDLWVGGNRYRTGPSDTGHGALIQRRLADSVDHDMETVGLQCI
jgi:hypothetical protein